MPHFGRRSRDRRDTCHSDVILLLDTAIEIIDFTILCGFRPQGDQEDAYADGRSEVRWPDSKHNVDPSVAWDAAPWHPVKPYIRWEDTHAFATLNGVFVAVSHRFKIPIRWGGGFKTLKDYNHWELDL